MSVPKDHLCLFKIPGLRPVLALQMQTIYAPFDLCDNSADTEMVVFLTLKNILSKLRKNVLQLM